MCIDFYFFNELSGGEELSIYDCNSLQSGDSVDSGLPKSHKRTDSSVSNSSGAFRHSSDSPSSNRPEYSRMSSDATAQISAQITEFHIMKANVVKPFAMYSIEVKSVNNIGDVSVQKIYRRYSDFYALHQKIIAKYPLLDKIPFPSKKAFGNMDSRVLEKRRCMLNAFIKELLKPETLQENHELIIFMTRFLDHTSSYESERQKETVLKSATTSVKNSVKTAWHVGTSVPSNIVHTGASLYGGISRVLTVSNFIYIML